jgi:membrane-bound lytic murein transglycosylase D
MPEPALLTSAEPVKIAKEEPAPLTKKSETRQKSAEQVAAERFIHQVQPGDTLWNISQKYDGISVEQIKKLNKLKSNSIKPGQKLILS